MNLFLPICRDSFINFEWILFNWKLPQSPGSERGLIWTWIALHPNKEKTEKDGTVTTGEDAFFPPWYCAPARPLHLGALFCLHLLVKLSLGPAGGKDPHSLPLVGIDSPGAVCVAPRTGEPGVLEASGGSYIPVPQLACSKMQSIWELWEMFLNGADLLHLIS